MVSSGRGFLVGGLLAFLIGIVGCSQTPPPPPSPADQFKELSDKKKAQLTQFLNSKQSELKNYKATVNEEPNLDLRGDHTHVGVIEFKYPVTKPEGTEKVQTWIEHTIVAEYVFSTQSKTWRWKQNTLKNAGGFMEPAKDKLLVTDEEVLEQMK